MGEHCAMQSERRCQVWQLAVGRETSAGHMHMPCLPGGGPPGAGVLVGRTYGGGCRSSCTGSVRYPVQHMYPAARIKKWFADTKEWFWDGMFVTRRTESPVKSASHYCLPFPRPTMRLPRSRNSRLVEVHHIHPPHSSETVASNMPRDEMQPQEPNPSGQTVNAGAVTAAEPQTPASSMQEGAAQPLNPSSRDSSNPSNATADIPESREPMQPDRSPELHDSQPVKQPSPRQKTSPKRSPKRSPARSPSRDHPKSAEPRPLADKVVRISHIEVKAARPSAISGGDQGKDGGHPCEEFTRLDYESSRCCPKFLRRRRICRRANWCPCIPSELKFLIRQGCVFCFTRTAGACLCLSSSCASLSFGILNVARTVDAISSTAVDVQEHPNCYMFLADMPGLTHFDVKVQVEDDSIVKIVGNKKPDDFLAVEWGETKYLLIERSHGKVMRKFSLPCNIYLDGISAACQDGLLTIIVPKCLKSITHTPRSFDVEMISLMPPESPSSLASSQNAKL